MGSFFTGKRLQEQDPQAPEPQLWPLLAVLLSAAGALGAGLSAVALVVLVVLALALPLKSVSYQPPPLS